MALVPGLGQPFDVLGNYVENRWGRLCLSRFLTSSHLLAPLGRPPLAARARPTRSGFPCPNRMPLSRAGSLARRPLMYAVPSAPGAPGAASVRVWHLMSWGWGPRTGCPSPEVPKVALYEAGWPCQVAIRSLPLDLRSVPITAGR
jgi:hypothetical protein